MFEVYVEDKIQAIGDSCIFFIYFLFVLSFLHNGFLASKLWGIALL